ncbi:MAG: hypothetical protein IPP87_03675 [Ideonella sp.]|nr:hypothetical protein [Ideonella sp.]
MSFNSSIRVAAWRVGAWAALLMLSACASPRMDIRPQISATGQPAYELRGTQLTVLQAEVTRLCPNGADVLRQTQRYERPEAEPGFVKRWTIELLDPPHTEAQMQVVCRA